MAQAGSNYEEEENWRSKISLDCPFKGDTRSTCKNNVSTALVLLPNEKLAFPSKDDLCKKNAAYY